MAPVGVSELFYVPLNSEYNVQYKIILWGFFFSIQSIISTTTYTCMSTHAGTHTHAKRMHLNCYCLLKALSWLYHFSCSTHGTRNQTWCDHALNQKNVGKKKKSVNNISKYLKFEFTFLAHLLLIPNLFPLEFYVHCHQNLMTFFYV